MSKLYVYHAIRRKKENPNLKEITLREAAMETDEDEAIMRLKRRLSGIGGQWRIYRSVNARDTQKTKIYLIKKLLDSDQYNNNLDTLWRTALMQPENKAERLYLIDLDTKDVEIVGIILSSGIVDVLNCVETPNGMHFVIKPASEERLCDYINDVLSDDNPIKLEEMGVENYLSVKKDALLYICSVNGFDLPVKPVTGAT